LSVSERARLAELERENRQLRLDNEFLGKAAALSTRQRNAASRVSAGVLNARVSRGRVLSLAAMASS
jgi:transposase-like protein